jgi:hypothetical protein
MPYRFTQVWARLLGVCGMAVMVASLIGAAALVYLGPVPLGLSAEPAGSQLWLTRAALAVACVALGFLVGGFLMVVGQLMRLLLHMGRLLARMEHRMRSWEGKLIQLFEEQPAVRKRGRPGL